MESPLGKKDLARLAFIDQQIRSGRYPTSRSLAADYEGVSSRTIKRDLEYMRDFLDAPIEFDAEHRGYRYTEASYRVPTLMVRESDLFAVALAQRVLEQYEATPLYARLTSLFRRIQDLLPSRVSVEAAELPTRLSFGKIAAIPVGEDVWNAVFAGLRESATLSFAYRVPRANDHTRRRVDPYHVICRRGDWYLVGNCHRSEEVRIFNFGRMRDARVEDRSFTIPKDFDVNRYVDLQSGVWSDTTEYRFVIDFDAEVSGYIGERVWHDGQEAEASPGGGLRLRFTTNQLVETVAWALSWGCNAQVVEPPEAAETAKAHVKAMAKRYGV